MAIIQIAKIQHRSGNIGELPQLDTAEFGLAVDTANSKHRLFIGPVIPVHTNTSPISNNIEILTVYSGINRIVNGSSNVSIMEPNGNVTFSLSGTPNVMVVSNTKLESNISFIINSNAATISNVSNSSIQLTGNGGISLANGNIALGGNIIGNGSPNNYFYGNWVFPNAGNSLTVGNINAGLDPSNLNGNWNIPFGNSLTVANIAAGANPGIFTGNWNFPAGPGNSVSMANLDAKPGNTAINPSYLNGNWALGTGATFQATYADLAEYYVADAHYEPGTVLEFGGEHEVTLATDETMRVAGVVSTNPAYGMNANCKGENVVAVALQGRVPCKVRGKIRKGDLMTSGGDGYARPTHSPKIGTIIGKSLQNFDGEGVIEVAVGRL